MLKGTRVLAWGSRSAVELAGRLLEHADAFVHTMDPTTIPSFDGYDVVISSSDTASRTACEAIGRLRASGKTIVCDITAVGPQSARAGVPWSDAQIQAMTGLMDTTGFSDGTPVLIGVPLTEISAAMYAASAVAAALRVWNVRGLLQNIDVSLFSCAANALTTFLPKAFTRSEASRVGNRHPACAPWAAYATQDGWILICTSTEEQWRRLKGVIGLDALDDVQFDTLANRIKHVDLLDSLIGKWSDGLTTEDCSRICEEIGVAAGPILSIEDLKDEANFRLRHPVAAQQLVDRASTRALYREVSPFRVYPLAPDGIEATSQSRGASRREYQRDAEAIMPCSASPLAGLKVIEIGQYTTAPLVGKHLAALGAEVIKIEPPDGEVARTWMPAQDGLSYFFALNNTDKSTISLNLKQPWDRAHLEELICTADVLVENLRPGVLAGLGFGRDALKRLNATLVYCSISGFGIASAYPTRPAFDTVIQAMGGLMDLTRSADVPVKIGASAADVLGGQAALCAIMAVLSSAQKPASTFVEISMQDVAAWCSLYATGHPPRQGLAVACADGYVWLDNVTDAGEQQIRQTDRGAARGVTRERAVEQLALLGIEALPVLRVAEFIEDPDFLYDVLSVGRDDNGTFWPVLKIPYRLSRTPATVRAVPGLLKPIFAHGS
jgi:crotonobetainyl-CoA:carnitine CoA-transferase CaiB-like acyl-CoA transferase